VTLQLDQLSAVMLLVVTGVGFLIHVYSAGYMHDDPDYPRFFTYLNLFVFSMVMLVLAGNFLLLYVFWEAVGLCSYLLIGFWYTRESAANAGKKAFIVNRVGDCGFALGIMLSGPTVGTLEYTEVFQKAPGLAVGNGHRHQPPALPGGRAGSRPSCRSTCGFPTPWRARRRSRP
jgi:NADH-quinone oxidoreductase subunit L